MTQPDRQVELVVEAFLSGEKSPSDSMSILEDNDMFNELLIKELWSIEEDLGEELNAKKRS